MSLFSLLTEEERISNLTMFKMIENEFKIQFPSQFLLFHKILKSGQFFENWEAYIDQYFRLFPIYEIAFQKDDISFHYGWLYSPSEIKIDLSHFSESGSYLEKFGMIRVGDIVAGGGLLLGVRNDNADKIYKIVWGIDKDPVFVSTTIFDFITNLKMHSFSELKKFEKTVSEKYFRIRDVDFKLSNRIKSQIGKCENYDLESPEFEPVNNLLDEINKNVFNVQGINT